MTAHEKVRELIKQTIYEWVKQNFGESEADDPSWDSDALADEVSHAKLMNQIYQIIRHEYTKQDVRNVIDSMGQEENLNEEDIDFIAERFEDEHDMDFSDSRQYEQLISDYLHYEKGKE